MRVTKSPDTARSITFDGQKWLPFKLGELPKKYQDVPPIGQFNWKGLTYISEVYIK